MEKWKVVTLQPQMTISEGGLIKSACTEMIIDAEHVECLDHNLLHFYNIVKEPDEAGFIANKKKVIALFSVCNIIYVTKEETSDVSLDPGDAAQILKPYCDKQIEKPEDNGNADN